ncbi:MAG: hypothetical protein GWO07_05950 [Candidatus Dadabacteria bacterium]|nr:hypothetical protein [Candidatus Dadabacteria bacterium]NIS08298.1 hypothetical protein [Candidatus Dadabacteria bacterium]NIV41646.1 hypothetical protein [Candidatus Dadabacteria bacterium]NIY21817.1 hypothetical protein [Candidatus Dadabacteria bacterium]
MGKYYCSGVLILFLLLSPSTFAGTELKINPKLRYSSDSNDGPLISGRDLSDAKLSSDKPSHIIFYHRQCYNSKRQAKRTVELYEKFKDKVNFIVIDLDEIRNNDQVKLRRKYYTKYIPHVTMISKDGKVLYDRAGEVRTDKLSEILLKEIDSSG